MFRISIPPYARNSKTRLEIRRLTHYGYDAVVRNVSGDAVTAVRKDKSCHRFLELMYRHGAGLNPSTPSCRHFQARSDGRP
jgi:hypothetical protein